MRVQEQAQLSSQDAGEVLFAEAKLRAGGRQHVASEQVRPSSSYMTGWLQEVGETCEMVLGEWTVDE